MKKIKVEEAIGMSIAHDLTGIVPGKYKGAIFKKGHIIKEEDVETLKSIGKNNIHIGNVPENSIHEDDAASRIVKAICNTNDFLFSEVSEGKISIIAKNDGVLKVDKELLFQINYIDDITVATKYNEIFVKKGKKVASARIIPFYTNKKNIEELEKASLNKSVIELKKMKDLKIDLIITGTEIYNGKIKDKSYDVIKDKLVKYSNNISRSIVVKDDLSSIMDQLNISIENKADMIILTGGISVDADDVTPIAISKKSDEVITYGAPVQPGNLFMLGYNGEIPLIGIPAAMIFNNITSFDIVLPLLMTGEKLNKDFFVKLSLGGLCSFCENCTYPNCTFGKGR